MQYFCACIQQSNCTCIRVDSCEWRTPFAPSIDLSTWPHSYYRTLWSSRCIIFYNGYIIIETNPSHLVLLNMYKWFGNTLIARGIGSNSSPSMFNHDLPTGWRIISELLKLFPGNWNGLFTVLDHLKIREVIIIPSQQRFPRAKKSTHPWFIKLPLEIVLGQRDRERGWWLSGRVAFLRRERLNPITQNVWWDQWGCPWTLLTNEVNSSPVPAAASLSSPCCCSRCAQLA